MKLRYAGNVMPFEDSMKKVAAITWAPSGRKFAVGAADRVLPPLSRPSISSTTMDKKKTSSPLNLQTKAKKAISLEVLNSPLTPRR